MAPSSVGSCPSVKSLGRGDAGESSDDVPRSDSRTCESVPAEKSLEDRCPGDSPSSSNSQCGVENPQPEDDVVLISNSCSSGNGSNGVTEVTEVTEVIQNCDSTPPPTATGSPEQTGETWNSRKRKRESKTNHTIIQNGSITPNDVR